MNGEVRAYGWAFDSGKQRIGSRFSTDAKRGYTNVGFRFVNGVARGGSMWETTHSMNDRVARRLSSNLLSQRGSTLGFRSV